MGFCCIDSEEEKRFLINIMGGVGERSRLKREVIKLERGKSF